MNNIEKKLDALINALGFDCKRNLDIKHVYRREDLQDNGEPKVYALPESIIDNSTYTVTKRNDLQRKYNLYMSALIEYQSGAATLEEFTEITKGLI